MRQALGITTALAIAALSLPLAAQTVQPGEIELHIDASGQVAPDRAEIDFNLRGKGETKAEADKKLEAGLAELRARLKELGIKPEQTRLTRGENDPVPIMIMPTVAPPAPPPLVLLAPPVSIPSPSAPAAPALERPALPRPRPSPSPSPSFWSNGTLSVSVSDVALVGRVLALRSADNAWNSLSKPRFSTNDPAAAAKLAVDRAFADARAKADVYAGAMGYKVVRVLRVSNAKPHINLPDALQTFSALDGPAGRDRLAMQSTVAAVAIDYAIAPK